MKVIHSSLINIQKDNLKVNVTIQSEEENLKYYFYLYQDGVLIEKKKGLDVPEYSVKLYEDGTYLVKYLIRDKEGKDIIGETKTVQFMGMKELISPYRINYLGNSKSLDQLDMRKYLNVEKTIEGISIATLSEDEMKKVCENLVENHPDSIIVDIRDQSNYFNVENLSEETENHIYEQWVKFVKKLRELNQIRVILIHYTFDTTIPAKKKLTEQLNYFYEIVYYAFNKYYHKLSEIPLVNNWSEAPGGEIIEDIKKFGESRRELIKHIQWKDGPQFKIYATRKDSMIYIEAQTQTVSEDLQYMFSLCKDRVLYERCPWLDTKSKTFQLTENGIYFVQVSVKNKSGISTKNSITFEYFNEDFQKEYQSFLNKEITPTQMDRPLKYFKGESPYNDFGLITIKEDDLGDKVESLQSFAKDTLAQEVYVVPSIGEYRNYLVSDIKPESYNEKQVILSGHCVDGESFIIGTEEVKNIVDIDQLSEMTGQFSAIVIDNEKITVTTDFFNASRLYYYQDSKYFIIANRYHLLILLCKQMKIDLALNNKQVSASLSSSDIGYERQNILCDMNISGLKEVRTGFYWQLNQQGWQQQQNELYTICNTKEIYHQAKYKEWLVKAKEEIVHNLETIFSHPRNEKIIVDLSGGLDTRTVYSAVTNITKNKEKIYVHAGSSPTNRDIEVASAINAIYDFKYDNTPKNISYDTMENTVNKVRSTDLGIYYNRPIQQRVERPKSIKLIGSCGESILRPYWIRNMYNTQLEYEYTIDGFMEMLESTIIPKVNTDYEQAFGEWQNLYKKELVAFPYEEVTEKFNYYSLAFGEIYHGHTILRNYLGYNSYMVLLAKELLRISSITHPVFKSYKLHMDFIAECNPVLGVINYESKYYNEIKGNIKDLYYSNPSLSGAVNLNTLEDTADWKMACHEQVTSVNVQVEKDLVYFNTNELEAMMYESTLYQLQQLMKQSEELSQILGRALYYYMTYREKSYAQILQYHHKITSVLDQLMLIKE